MVLVTLAVALVLSLPARYQLTPGLPWLALVIGLVPMLAVTVAPGRVAFHRWERWSILGLVFIGVWVELGTLVRLVVDMVVLKHVGAIELLESAVMWWTINILLFALLYWQIDGAALELGGGGGGHDFHFAERDDPEPHPPRRPTFVDYLYLAFVASTAFSPPDYARPLSARAKLTLMVQSSISLTTLFVVASRAIATLS